MTQQDEPEFDPDLRSDQKMGFAPDSESLLPILRYCITAVMLGSVALALTLLAIAPDQLGRMGGVVGVFSVGLVALFFLRRGRAQMATHVLLVGMWASVTGIVVFTGGVRAPLVIFYPSYIFIVGWLVGSRAAVLVTGATIASTLCLLWVESRGWLPVAFTSSSLMFGGDQVIVYGLTALLTCVLVRTFQGRLTELRRVGRVLTLRTLDLEASQAELKQAQVALQGSEARYRTLIEWSPESILVHRRGIVLYVNPAAIHMFGASDASALLGKKTQDLIHPDHRESQLKRMNSIVAHDVIPPMVESTFIQLDGTPIDVEVQGTSILYDGIDAIHVSIRNITERKQMQDRVHQLAFYDSLTRLPNRRLLDDRLRQALTASKRRTRFGALMFLDLDKLKPINDTYGHEVGDALLVEVAQRLAQCVRESDTVGRLGGDEFVVILTDLDALAIESASQAAVVAQKIRVVLAQPYALKTGRAGGATLAIGCAASIGVVLFGDSDTDQDVILKRADMAMYRAKKAGGNSVVFEGVWPV